jgi:hypothetical protein
MANATLLVLRHIAEAVRADVPYWGRDPVFGLLPDRFPTQTYIVTNAAASSSTRTP